MSLDPKSIAAGKILISEPFMDDPNFKRSVVLICEHEPLGSFGLILNKLLDFEVGQLIPELVSVSGPMHYGGPVAPDTLHFLHSRGDLFDDCAEVESGLFWGGDFERLKFFADTGQIKTEEIRFFLGYSGWSEGQLLAEMGLKSWIVSAAKSSSVFESEPEQLWRTELSELGGQFKVISNFPEDPSLN